MVPDTETPPPSKVTFLLLGSVTLPVHPLPVHFTVSPDNTLVSAALTVVSELQLTIVVLAQAEPHKQTLTRKLVNDVLIAMPLSPAKERLVLASEKIGALTHLSSQNPSSRPAVATSSALLFARISGAESSASCGTLVPCDPGPSLHHCPQ